MRAGAEALGSASAYAAMDARMTAVMGRDAADRMRELLGRQVTGCATGTAGTMGPGMMAGGWMRSAQWSWMSDGRWQHMSGADWRAVRAQMMGGGTAGGHHSDAWRVVLVVVTALGLAALGVIAGVALARRRPSGPAGAAPSH